MICRTEEEIKGISGTLCSTYMAHFEAALDGRSLAMPENRHVAEAARIGRTAGEKYLRDENDRIG